MKTNRIKSSKSILIASVLIGTSSLILEPNITDAQSNYQWKKVVATVCMLNGQIYSYSNDCSLGAGECIDRSCP